MLTHGAIATSGASVSLPGWCIDSAKERTYTGATGSRRLTSARLCRRCCQSCPRVLRCQGLVCGTSVKPKDLACFVSVAATLPDLCGDNLRPPFERGVLFEHVVDNFGQCVGRGGRGFVASGFTPHAAKKAPRELGLVRRLCAAMRKARLARFWTRDSPWRVCATADLIGRGRA
jgi:hypothetical protein